ncbi:hypothetical protein KFK09_009669 [Dendrobium nobile]|uniref:Uncharacterized protein n=1 Tax=Dendrobium nobile TaxID=94219 RepID=A0A8T3BLK2_DENNO|nr:hypothetical protein KFK09_009669 [Dendrobium nobile]
MINPRGRNLVFPSCLNNASFCTVLLLFFKINNIKILTIIFYIKKLLLKKIIKLSPLNKHLFESTFLLLLKRFSNI